MNKSRFSLPGIQEDIKKYYFLRKQANVSKEHLNISVKKVYLYENT